MNRSSFTDWGNRGEIKRTCPNCGHEWTGHRASKCPECGWHHRTGKKRGVVK
ncbi:MAG: hydrogenase maturation nickel metallochaperone HypA [Fibrobacter sp.]|nr:hydrogenase maturation nickel metallochaperone HypA [Fibrobacter sp.]